MSEKTSWLRDLASHAEQARALEDLQRVEKMMLTDRAAHSTMTPQQRRDYAEYRVNHQTKLRQNVDPTSRARQEPPDGPATWCIRQRLAAGADTLPWLGESELLEQATSGESKTWHSQRLARKARALEQLERQHARLDKDYSKRKEAAALAREREGARAELQRLEGMSDLELHCALLAENERRTASGEARERAREAILGGGRGEAQDRAAGG